MRKKMDEREATRIALEALRGINESMLEEGILSDERRRRIDAAFKEAGLAPLRTPSDRPVTEEMGPGDIKALRERLGVRQPVLAEHLGIASGTLSQWERGVRKPDGPALRLLSLIGRHGLDYVR